MQDSACPEPTDLRSTCECWMGASRRSRIWHAVDPQGRDEGIFPDLQPRPGPSMTCFASSAVASSAVAARRVPPPGTSGPGRRRAWARALRTAPTGLLLDRAKSPDTRFTQSLPWLPSEARTGMTDTSEFQVRYSKEEHAVLPRRLRTRRVGPVEIRGRAAWPRPRRGKLDDRPEPPDRPVLADEPRRIRCLHLRQVAPDHRRRRLHRRASR